MPNKNNQYSKAQKKPKMPMSNALKIKPKTQKKKGK